MFSHFVFLFSFSFCSMSEGTKWSDVKCIAEQASAAPRPTPPTLPRTAPLNFSLIHAPDCEHGVALQLQRPAGSPLLHLPPSPQTLPPPSFASNPFTSLHRLKPFHLPPSPQTPRHFIVVAGGIRAQGRACTGGDVFTGYVEFSTCLQPLPLQCTSSPLRRLGRSVRQREPHTHASCACLACCSNMRPCPFLVKLTHPPCRCSPAAAPPSFTP